MAAYDVAYLRKIDVNAELVTYLKKIDSTLEPYNGRFLVHGKKSEVVEGTFPGHLIIIEFPDLENANGWYHSESYQQILPLRTNNSEGSVVIIDGVADEYRAVDLLSKIN